MMRIRMAAAVLNQTPLDWEGNRANVLAAIEAARRADVKLLCLPELCITGYGCEDAFHAADVAETAWEILEELAPAAAGMVVSVGLPVLHKGALFNCAALLAERQIVGLAAKRFLAGEGLHYEPRWFKPWPAGIRDTLCRAGRTIPIGELVFSAGGVRIGFEICEDAWVAKRPAGAPALAGVDVILNPSASHFAFGKHEVRRRLVVEGSRAFCVSYLYTNLLGNEAGRIVYDGGAMIASAGRLLATGPRLGFAPCYLTDAVVDVEQTRMTRARSGSYQPLLGVAEESEVRFDFVWPDVEPEVPRPAPADWENGPALKEGEFCRAVTLALFDYLRKSRAQGFVVNVSGGADSSAVACLVALMVRFAVTELGQEGLCRALEHIEGLNAFGDIRALVGRLLRCVYQESRNSSRTTRDAAAAVVEGLGGQFAAWTIDPLVEQYVAAVEGVLGRPLAWDRDDLALQNIQARARGPGAWLLANVEGRLLLATSNRSEAAVGYATMDGDTCGSLSPIAGIDKAFLLRWLRWLETEGPAGVGPLTFLAAVNRLAPTAELRPPSAHQTDEDDLMPYAVLDAIERAAIRDKQSPVEVLRLIRTQFAEYPLARLHQWVERFFRLWSRNQWKRERYAPSFHLDDENLDPKTWCRFPILSGGFARELAELARFVTAQ